MLTHHYAISMLICTCELCAKAKISAFDMQDCGSGIDKVRKGDPGADQDLKEVSRYYDRMITDFNMGKF